MTMMSNDANNKWFNELLHELPGGLDELERKYPGFTDWVDEMREKLEEIMELLNNQRPPRLLLVGRRGAGKSSLVNAMFQAHVAEVGSVTSQTGRCRWHLYEDNGRAMEILDTRGFAEGGHPQEETAAETAGDEIWEAIAGKCPDAILFLQKAKEVDAHIDADIKAVADLRKRVLTGHHYDVPVIGVVTQIDELDPLHVSEPPFDEHPRKRENIQIARETLAKKLYDGFEGAVLRVFPVCAYQDFNEKPPYSRCDGIEELVRYLIEKLPNESKLSMAQAAKLRRVQEDIARRHIVRPAAIAAGGIGATPIPVADAIPLTGLQFAMIIGVGYVGGHKLNKETAADFAAAMGVNVAVAFGAREIARALLKLFPGVGWAISGGVAYAATMGLGEAAIAYFIKDRSAEEAKEVLEEERERHMEEEMEEDPTA